MFEFDWQALIKYLLEGLGVALAAFYIPRKNLNFQEILMIALTAAATFALLDQFSPGVAAGARQGTGFGIGLQVSGTGLGMGGVAGPAEGFNDVTDTTETTESVI